LLEPLIRFGYLTACSPAGADHQLYNALQLSGSLFALQLVSGQLRLLLDNEIHRALSFFIGHESQISFVGPDDSNQWSGLEGFNYAKKLQVSSSVFQIGAYA
jgi:hypothetical protein